MVGLDGGSVGVAPSAPDLEKTGNMVDTAMGERAGVGGETGSATQTSSEGTSVTLESTPATETGNGNVFEALVAKAPDTVLPENMTPENAAASAPESADSAGRLISQEAVAGATMPDPEAAGVPDYSDAKKTGAAAVAALGADKERVEESMGITPPPSSLEKVAVMGDTMPENIQATTVPGELPQKKRSIFQRLLGLGKN